MADASLRSAPPATAQAGEDALQGFRFTGYMRPVDPDTGEPRTPTARQLAFLCERTNHTREVLYGGAAGGGKSDALLMAALQYVDRPGYRALLLRRTFQDLALPGALMDRARHWLGETDARWVAAEKTWVFPSGATLTFGFLEQESHKYRYQGANFHFIGFDELTQFTESQYRYLFSRLRKGMDDDVPLRMRSGSNPGGVGHSWVRQRFMVQKQVNRAFIPAKLDDNPHLDQQAYIESLMELDPVTRQQLLAGDWNAEQLGNKFRRSWFTMVEPHQIPSEGMRVVRFWDFAATEPKPGIDPDWTVGVLMGFHATSGYWYLLDVKRFRGSPGTVKEKFRTIAEQDHADWDGDVTQYIEQEPGSAGKHLIDDYMTTFAKFDVMGKRPSGKKEVRANPVSSRAEAGKIIVVRGPWYEDFMEELELFPYGQHDDQVDAFSGAYEALADGAAPAAQIITMPGFYTPVREVGDLRLVGEKYIDKP